MAGVRSPFARHQPKPALTDTHLVDKRISDLLSDLLEWDHDGDVEEAGALFARNAHIAGQVADLIEEHIVIASTRSIPLINRVSCNKTK